MEWTTPLSKLVQHFLPNGARIIKPQAPKGAPEIQTNDMDGDRKPEIIVGYLLEGEPHVLILRSNDQKRYRLIDIKGTGYNINYLGFTNIISPNKKDLVIGWQIGAAWVELNIYTLENDRIRRIVAGIPTSKIEIADMSGRDGRMEIALWVHDTGEAYRIEVLRWNGSKLVPAEDAYPYYFPKVVDYYERKIREMPDAAFYWYYLADAQWKAGMPEKALISINKGVALGLEYPSRETFEELRNKVLAGIGNRNLDLYVANVNEIGGLKWGYINENGDFIIKPIFQWAEDFQANGLAVVTKDGASGVIDQKGNYVVASIYDSIGSFSEGRAVAWDEGGVLLIDEQGKVMFRTDGYLAGMHDGRSVFSEEDSPGGPLYGYIDRDGKVVISPKYKSASNFNEGKAVVQLNDESYALIGLHGEILEKYNYKFVGDMSEGLLPFKETDDGKFGYMDEKGRVIIKPRFDGVQRFQNGRAVVNIDENYIAQYGLIDRKGNFVIQPIYNDIRLLGEKRVAVGIPLQKDIPFAGSRYAIADINGKIFTDFVYYDMGEYHNGIASANNGNTTFFVNKTGKIVTSLPKVEGAGTLQMKGNIIKANVDQRISYLNKSGKVIWKQNNDIRVNDRYVVREEKYKPNRNYLVYYPRIEGMDSQQLQRQVNMRLRKLAAAEGIPSNKELDYSYQGDFAVTFFNKDLVEIEITGYNYPFGAAHGMPTQIYVHVDLKKGIFYELKDLFKKDSDYVKILSEIIRKQIISQGEDSAVWLDSYEGIKENQPFFITEDTLNIYFYPYEIAPYAAGFPTFGIPFREIMGIIDTQGSFWRSFHY